jgi:hypothetical protein
MVGKFDQLVDIVSDFVEMIGKVRGVGKHILFFRFLVKDQSSQERTYRSPFCNIEMVRFTYVT